MSDSLLCQQQALITEDKLALSQDGVLSEDTLKPWPISSKRSLVEFGPRPKHRPNGAETSLQELLSLESQENGLLAWVILAALSLAAAPSSASFPSAPENATANPASSLKSLSSSAGSTERWEPVVVLAAALAAVPVAVPVAAPAVAPAPEFLPALPLAFS